MKTCSKCGESKPATTEYFYRKRFGLEAQCKQCRCKMARDRDRANPEIRQKYRQDNKEKIKARGIKYRSIPENKAKIKKRQQTYYQDNREMIITKERKRYQDNKEEIQKHRQQKRKKRNQQLLSTNQYNPCEMFELWQKKLVYKDDRGYYRDTKTKRLISWIVIEKHIRRKLVFNPDGVRETVHHINENKEDNRLHNLSLEHWDNHGAYHRYQWGKKIET